jgi:hypothetical protein
MPPIYFQNLSGSDSPGVPELHLFVREVRDFLKHVVSSPSEFGFLWADNPDLEALARDTFREDVSPGVALLDHAIVAIPETQLRLHGLRGAALKFKLTVIETIAQGWERIKDQFSARDWFKKMCDAIDALLDSLIQAAGVGGVIKEFKDALAALA